MTAPTFDGLLGLHSAMALIDVFFNLYSALLNDEV